LNAFIRIHVGQFFQIATLRTSWVKVDWAEAVRAADRLAVVGDLVDRPVAVCLD
jgi:hypothetical protein